MRKGTDFEVLVSDYSSSVDEWRQAQLVPKDELPALSRQQREVAKKMRVSEEDYQRNVLAGRLGEMRLQSRGEALGKIIQQLLQRLGSEFRLDAVKGEMVNCRWLCRIETPEKLTVVAFPRELVDDVLDSGAAEELERLKRSLYVGLGQGSLLATH